VENPTIGWSKDIISFKVMGQDPEIILESYSDIPENMVSALTDDLKSTKTEDISRIDTKLYKFNSLKTKLRNCLTPAFGDGIEESMPEGTSNKDGRILFILIISRNFPDKEAHTHIIRDYIMELEITKSNSVESYQRGIFRHLKQYNNIKGTEWKQIMNIIIKQYRKSDDPAFQTGLNIKFLSGPKKNRFFKWIVELIIWTIEMRQDFISQNLWPKIEIADNHEFTMMPMHATNSWTTNKKTKRSPINLGRWQRIMAIEEGPYLASL
jgi:hypothetical protein